MDFTGKIVGITKNWNDDKWHLTLTVNEEASLESVNGLKDIENLAVHIGKVKKKRSLDANAYLWVLCSQIAEVVNSSKEEVYEDLLQKYGTFYKDDEGYITVTVKDCVDMTKIQGHWKLIKEVNGFKSYLMIKGSSEYDTQEMTHLLDGVVYEAKELGIDTKTDKEREEMLEAWAKSYQS